MNPKEKKVESITVLENIRLTPAELADKLLQTPDFALESEKKLTIYNMNVNDFITAIAAKDQTSRLQVLFQMMKNLSVDIELEGSISIGDFNIGDHSWTISTSNSGSLKIKSKPSMVIKSIEEMVSFLTMMDLGKGFPLKGRQDLLLTGLSRDAMLDYYRLCQEKEDAASREKGQDDLFDKASPTLALKGISLKIYGLNAAQVDRNIDVNAGGILFKATSNSDEMQPHLILALLAKKSN